MLTRFLKACGLLAMICAATALAAEPTTKPGPPQSVEITVEFFDIPTSVLHPGIPDGSLFQLGHPDKPIPVMPGILSLGGALTKEQVDIALKDVRNNKDVDSLTVPALFARSGSSAKLLMIQEVRYATEYGPGLKNGAPPIPTKFNTENVGVTIEATPTIGDDGNTIDLVFSPRLVRLIGYQEPGSEPVYFKRRDSIKDWAAAAVLPAEFPQNETLQPIFATQEVTTQINTYDGASVILGGLTSNDPSTGEQRQSFIVVTTKLVPGQWADYYKARSNRSHRSP
jgi:type II secretory pathway component GspD/PulD (secretin)